jgi:hypothetical protein
MGAGGQTETIDTLKVFLKENLSSGFDVLLTGDVLMALGQRRRWGSPASRSKHTVGT